MKRPANFEIYEIDYTRPVEFQDILDLMVRLSGYTRRQPFTLEIRLMKNKVRYLLLSDQLDTPYLHKMLQVSNDIQFSKLHPKERNRPKNRGMLPLNATILVSKQTALKTSLVPF